MHDSSLNLAIYEQLQLPQKAAILDIGCRDSSFLQGFVRHFPGQIEKAVGVDQSDRGFGNFPISQPITLQKMDCSQGIAFPDRSFDFIFSKDMFECVTDKELFVHEIYRICKPGGTVLCVNCDWDSIVYNGENKELIRKALHAYAETKQAWMDDLDSWIGRRMLGFFRKEKGFSCAVTVHTVVETDYRQGMFGYEFAEHIGWLAKEKTGALSPKEYRQFIQELQKAQQKNNYLFAKPYYICKAVRNG